MSQALFLTVKVLLSCFEVFNSRKVDFKRQVVQEWVLTKLLCVVDLQMLLSVTGMEIVFCSQLSFVSSPVSGKMGINQSYLFVLLLASLSTLCTSDCPTTAPASINQSAQTPYQECAKLYAVLEAALLENPGNLYQLHYCFFPSSSIEPLYASVSFKLNSQSYYLCWTSSVVFRSVHPSVIISFQTLLLIVLLPIDTSGRRAGITTLDLSIKPANFTESDFPDYNTTIGAVLKDFTSLVSVWLEECRTMLSEQRYSLVPRSCGRRETACIVCLCTRGHFCYISVKL